MTAPHFDPDTVIRLVGDAVTAPSMHNAQPWKFVFHVGSGALSLYGDAERAMTRTDPDHRSLHLGCAAALFNLRVSAARSGLPVRVQLLPDDAEPWLLATVTIDETADTDRESASCTTPSGVGTPAGTPSARSRCRRSCWTVCGPRPVGRAAG